MRRICGGMEALMENNPTRISRERINENYLRQMLRDDARNRTRGEARASQNNAYSHSVPVCEFDGESSCLNNRSLAMVYAPMQAFRNLYDTKSALHRGTIFKELDKPFMGYRK